MARLDEVLEPWAGPVEQGYQEDNRNELIRAAIREAYRIGHDDGRHARIPQGETTFIGKLRKEQDGSKS